MPMFCLKGLFRFPRSLLFCTTIFAALYTKTIAFGHDLIQNGSFEEFPGGVMVGWSTEGAGNFVINEPQRCAHGNNCAKVPGFLFQNISTTPGYAYEITFAFGGNDLGQVNPGPLHVLWGTTELASLPVRPGPRYEYLTYMALAESTLTRLAFTTLPLQSFPYIDDVRVNLVAVPEPNTSILLAVLFGGGAVSFFREKRTWE